MLAKTKVTHFVPALFGEKTGVLGGAERYVWELARHMAEQTSVRLVTFGAEARTWNEQGLDVHVLKPSLYVRKQQNNPWSFSLFPFFAASDVLHFHQKHILMASLGAAVSKFFFRKRVFVTDLGGGGWDLSAYFSTDSFFSRELHLSEYSRGLYPRTSSPFHTVIWGGVDTRKFSFYGGPREDFFLFVGRILPHKGIDRLVTALPAGAHLKIAGASYDNEYLEYLRRHGKGKAIDFLGAVDEEQLLELYQSARALILPSVYQDYRGQKTRVPELLGQTVLEGMSCGTPVIVSDVASLPELIENGVEGIIFPWDETNALRDALQTLLKDPGKCSAMGKAGRKRVESRFTWDKTVARCLECYGL